MPMKVWALASSAAIAIVLGITVLKSTSAASPTLTIDPNDYGALGIENVQVVLADSTSNSTVSRQEAVDAAAGYLGRPTDASTVLHGTVLITADDPRGTWIVLFPGGNWPLTGPPGMAPSTHTVTMTGIYVDDKTGEVVGGFME